MATWSSAELANHVLIELGIIGAGQTGSAEDTLKVTEAWGSIYARLRRLNIARWTSEAIDLEAQEPLVRYMAGLLSSKFQFTGRRLAELKMTGSEGWDELKQVSAGDRHRATARIEDF